MIVVIAGGIGSGKSTVMNILNGLGASVVYADEVNRELLNDNNYIQLIDSNFNGVVING
ncbi:MAG: dephospho-CoA kinase, partial [Clostridia bacterium]|nr:dephospho-CoA kinase [Clostridia bacterium]